MSFPTGLFVDAPEMEDVSMHQLSEDSAMWPEEIVMKLKERLPQSDSLSMVVKFMKKDDETGTATGAVVISDSANMAYVPLVIKDFMMYPLDVFVIKQKLLPLTPDYFKSSFQNNGAFQRLEEYPNYGGMGRFDDGNLWNTIYPPSLGRYAYASNLTFPILNDIAETIDPKDMNQHLKENPADLARLLKHGHKDLLQKLSHLQPVNMNEYHQSMENLLNKNIYMLKRESPDKYSILACSDKVFSPVLKKVHGNSDELCKFKAKISDCAQDDINDVDMNGEKVIVLPTVEEPVEGPYLEQPVQRRMEFADEFDHYVVKKKDGVEVEGVVIPKVINFNMELIDQKIFIGKTMSTIQPAIAGVRVQNSSFRLKDQAGDMQPGQTGTLVYQMNPSKALATIPFTIVCMSVEPCGKVCVKAQDLAGVTFKFESSPMTLERIASLGDKYLVPSEFFWVPMEGFHEISNSQLDFVAKTASDKLTLISTGYNQYSLSGVDKYASALGWSSTNLSANQTKFLLATHGLGKVAEEILTKAKKEGSIKLAYRRPAVEKRGHSDLLKKFAYNLKSNLIKAASFVENSQSVDSLLSLNFINPDNIAKFVSRLPSLKATISDLAMLLIASRLGVKELPESSLSSAMSRMIDVVNGLETLRATQEQQQ